MMGGGKSFLPVAHNFTLLYFTLLYFTFCVGIGVSSTPGKGTLFRVELPFALQSTVKSSNGKAKLKDIEEGEVELGSLDYSTVL